MSIYDLIIIGAGPAGYTAAERAASAGMKTALVEKDRIGGVCLNEGCIPTKTLLYSAKIYDNAVNGSKYGVIANDIRFDHSAVLSRKEKTIRKLTGGISSTLRSCGTDLIKGNAMILGKKPEGYAVSVNDEVFLARRLLIASGSSAMMPGIPGAADAYGKGIVLTNREILDLKEIPSDLTVIGGGIIGLEMASYFNSAGSSVTIIEMLDHIAGQTDTDISSILKKNYEQKGIVFKLGCRVTSINGSEVAYEQNGESFSIGSDKILMSVGRVPASKGIGLENIDVELSGASVKTDDRCRTNVPEVYAAGDINGKSLLAHTAYREAEVSVNNMLGKKDLIRYETIPSVIYTNPEVACVGHTERSAGEKGIAADVITTPMSFSGRYVAENEGGDGICKVVIEKTTRKIIGIHIIGNPSSEIIYGAGLMMENEMRIDDIKELVFPHPTVSEIIRESIFKYR